MRNPIGDLDFKVDAVRETDEVTSPIFANSFEPQKQCIFHRLYSIVPAELRPTCDHRKWVVKVKNENGVTSQID